MQIILRTRWRFLQSNNNPKRKFRTIYLIPKFVNQISIFLSIDRYLNYIYYAMNYESIFWAKIKLTGWELFMRLFARSFFRGQDFETHRNRFTNSGKPIPPELSHRWVGLLVICKRHKGSLVRVTYRPRIRHPVPAPVPRAMDIKSRWVELGLYFWRWIFISHKYHSHE